MITDGDYLKKLEEYTIQNETNMSAINFLQKYITDNSIIGKSVRTSINNSKIYNDTSNFAEYNIVGVIDDNLDYGIIYYNKSVVSDLISDNLIMSNIFTRVNNTQELKTILEYYPINNSDTLSRSVYSDNLLSSVQASYVFKTIGRYGTIFFLIFAVVILMNFINNSIKFRKKEIGILRAIGCRSIDVMKIFMYECLSLMIICLLIAFAIIPKIISSINSFISSSFYNEIDVMNFGLSQIFGVAAIMIVIVILASIIPIRRLTKMKPIDTILDK
jgi:ABC-type antimicrobial peptide transport system permease subunit